MRSGNSNSLDQHGRFVAIARSVSAAITIDIDGETVEVPDGLSILAAVLSRRSSLRLQLTNDAPRAGFCLMGACQECWIWLEDGHRVRACTTVVSEGIKICTTSPAGFPTRD